MIKLKLIGLLMTMTWVGYAQSNGRPTADTAERRILTLDECIQIAMTNNIQLKQVRNRTRIAKANDFQSIMNFLPSVSGFGNFNWNNGTSFDNSSGQFFTGDRQSSFLDLNANLVVFNGMNNYYNKKATTLSLESNVQQIAAQSQDVRSSVLGSYLSVVLDKENIKISTDRLDLLNAQLNREKKREKAGVGDLEQVYNFQSQLANENLRRVNLENKLMTDMLQLLQSLQLEVSLNYDIAPYEFENETQILDREKFQDVLDQSLNYSPLVKSAKADADASHYNFKATQTSMIPTISLIGDYTTRYSSLNNLELVDQYQNLTNKSIELRMIMPIFNNYRNRTNTQVAKINKENASLQLEQTELEVTNIIQQVYVNLINAQATFSAAEDNLAALNQSFEFVKTRYEHGNTDFYTYLESLNNKNRAEVELVNAKYSIIFRKKILDVYRGLL